MGKHGAGPFCYSDSVTDRFPSEGFSSIEEEMDYVAPTELRWFRDQARHNRGMETIHSPLLDTTKCAGGRRHFGGCYPEYIRSYRLSNEFAERFGRVQ